MKNFSYVSSGSIELLKIVKDIAGLVESGTYKRIKQTPTSALQSIASTMISYARMLAGDIRTH